MKTLRLGLAILSLAAAACGSAPPEGSDQTLLVAEETEDAALDDAKADGQCVRRHHACTQGGTACCTGFCRITGYVTSACVAPQRNGASCSASAQCKSGVCTDYVCVVAGCGAIGKACQKDGECCAGSFCNNLTYAPWACATKLANSSWCDRDSQCQSGSCANYQCTPKP